MIILRISELVTWSKSLSSDYCYLQQRTMEIFCYCCCSDPRVPGSSVAIFVSRFITGSQAIWHSPPLLWEKTKHTSPVLDWKLLRVQLGKKSPHTQKCLDLKAFQHQPCPRNGTNLPSNLQVGPSLSVFKQYHSWVSCCFQVELNSTTVTPSAKAGVGRDKKCQSDLFCAFPPQGYNPSNPPSSGFLSPALLVPKLNPILRLAHLAHSGLRWQSILILHILAADNHSFK